MSITIIKWTQPPPTPPPSNFHSVVTVTANTLLTTANDIVLVDTTPGGVNIIILLPPVAVARGFEFQIKKIDAAAHTVIIAAQPGETIGGLPTKVLSIQGEAVFVAAPDAPSVDWDLF